MNEQHQSENIYPVSNRDDYIETGADIDAHEFDPGDDIADHRGSILTVRRPMLAAFAIIFIAIILAAEIAPAIIDEILRLLGRA